MEKVPFQTVQNAIDAICSLSTEEELGNASDHLFDVQPDLGGFFMEFIEDMSEGAQDLGFMMALILNRSFEDQYKSLRIMDEDEVVARFESTEKELEKYAKIDEAQLEEMFKTADNQAQPDVFKYLLEELFLSDDLEPALAGDEQSHLFIICKFFADCLHELAAESGGKLQH